MKKNVQVQPMKTTDLEKHRLNIRIILQCSNATPIKCHSGIGYACCFCTEKFPEPADLKRHTLEGHDDKTKLKFMHRINLSSYLVKLDITSLSCIICDTSIDSLEQLLEHLTKNHGKQLFTDIKSHIIPFKFSDEELRCIYCLNVFFKFKRLLEHMNDHFRNYICNVCDAGFPNRRNLQTHEEAHKLGTFNCDLCSKVFDTNRKKKLHEKNFHKNSSLISKCNYCDEKFTNYRQKGRHMVAVHGVLPRVIKCQACDKTFTNKLAFTNHTKNYHLMERPHKCMQCDMKFFTKAQLTKHILKHTGKKQFKCDVCFKMYGRKNTLREHMRIHENDRRFKCEHCGQAFVQKCSWAGHMRSKHGDVV